MTTTEYALSLIKDERDDQIIKHGFTSQHALEHPDDYAHGEMANAAAFALTGEDKFWPSHRDVYYKNKISGKSKQDRLIVAGALIIAELEREYLIRFDGLKNLSKGEGSSFEDWKKEYFAYSAADGVAIEQKERHTDMEWLQEKYDDGQGVMNVYLDEHYE